MSSKWRERIEQAFGFRLAWWYALVFLASSLALVTATYFLLAATLRQHDREIVQSTLVQFAAAYTRGGVDALTREIQWLLGATVILVNAALYAAVFFLKFQAVRRTR